jgi:acetyltransferase-like isoleucine patch superfamily enzyme
MALLRSSRKHGVRTGRGVQLGRRVQLEVLHGGVIILGDGCRIGDRTRIVVQGGRVEIGAGATLGERCTIVAHERVTIGEAARLYDGAVLVDFDHVVDDVERPIRTQPLVCSPIAIGERVRLGLGAGVLRGVSIGADATVGPHAVVTRDVAAGVTVAGVPARPRAALDD